MRTIPNKLMRSGCGLQIWWLAVFICAVPRGPSASASTLNQNATWEASSSDGVTSPELEVGAIPGIAAGIENLNLYNGHLTLTIPLLHIGGRGETGYTMVLPVDRSWALHELPSPEGTVPWSQTAPYSPELDYASPVPYSPGLLVIRQSVGGAQFLCSGQYYYPGPYLTTLVWIDPTGAQTTLVDTNFEGQAQGTTSGTCSTRLSSAPNRGTTFVSEDGTSTQFISTQSIYDAWQLQTTAVSGTLYFRNGTKYTISNGNVTQIEDRNGNLVTFHYGTGSFTVTDAVNRGISVSYSSTQDVITYEGYGGAPRTITVSHTAMENVMAQSQGVQSYSCLFPGVGNEQGNWNPTVTSSVTLADGSSYSFSYNSYGEVARLKLPTGGAYQYSYPETSGCSGTVGVTYRPLQERDELANGSTTSAKTVYTATTESSGLDPNHSSRAGTLVQANYEDANGNLLRLEKHYFYGNPASSGTVTESETQFSAWWDGLEFRTDIADASTTWRSVQSAFTQRPCASGENCWFGTPEADTAPPHDAQLCQSNVTIDNGQVSGRLYAYDQYNNQTDIYEYGYGAAPALAASCPRPPSSYARHTNRQYETGTYTSASVYILNLPAAETGDVGGTVFAKTQYTYDANSLTNEPGIIGHDNANYGGNAARGNPTSISRCGTPSNCNWMTTQLYYDIAGNTVQVTDADGHAASYASSDNYSDGVNRNSYARVTTATNALGMGASCQWDYGTGKPTTATDVNGVKTTYAYNDSLDRLTQMVQAAGLSGFQTQTNVVYTSPTDVNMYQDQNTFGDQALRMETQYDGLGRKSLTNEYEGGGSYIQTTETYDALGRVAETTNPSRPGDGLNYATLYGYDALGRPTSVTTPDGAVASTSYSGFYTTVTDQAGNARVLYTDALGRLAAVWEGTSPGGYNYETTYAYDGLDDLTQVNQGSETRNFSYDGLGRLTSATNVESGTVSYSYDGVGNLLSRTDALPKTTTYSYDALNRVTQKVYSDGTPAAYYQYDAAGAGYSYGRLTQASNANSTTTYVSIDPLGRVTASNQQTGGESYGFTYAYNLAGALVSETYPSGRVIATGYDGANRPSVVTGTYNQAQTNYVSGMSYWPHGAPSTYAYGNTVWPGFTYNNRLQPNQVYATLNSNSNQFLYYFWLNWGSTNNNGNLLQLDEEVGNAVPYSSLTVYGQNFSYDALNRLTNATDSGGWSRSFAYDQYGNGWVTGWTGQGLSPMTPTSGGLYNGNNQIGSSPYDAAGNMTVLPPGMAFTYDAENRQTSVTNTGGGMSATYVYDGQGQRVEKVLSSGQTVLYVYDALGKLAAEYDVQSAGAAPCVTCYLGYDHLGSLRLVTDQNGNIVARHDYLPYGEEIPGGIAGRSGQFDAVDNVNQKFTGEERDTETTLDYFQARYYAGGMGRFMSVDPGNAGADPSDPQTWNGYGYVRNSPLIYVDPNGTDAMSPDIIVDGVQTSWRSAFGMNGVLGGSMVACPGACSGFNGSGNYSQFTAGAGLAQSGYWTFSLVNVSSGLLGDADDPGVTTGQWDFTALLSTPQDPPKSGRQPNKITCSTVLPNGRTVGSYVNLLSNSINAAAGNPVSTPYGPAPNPSAPGPISVAGQVYSGTNFREMFGKGAGYTTNAFLGDAGNFAYAAVSANIGVPYFATELAAAAYSWTHHPPSDWVGPYGMDPSATVQIPAGYGASCNGY